MKDRKLQKVFAEIWMTTGEIFLKLKIVYIDSLQCMNKLDFHERKNHKKLFKASIPRISRKFTKKSWD